MDDNKLTATFVAPVGYKVTDVAFKDDGSVLLFMDKSKHPHAELIAQCEQEKIDYPEFWRDLWQFKRVSGAWVKFLHPTEIENDGCEYRQHPHRENIIAWHACSNEDKKRWQINIMGEWEDITGIPEFSSTAEYRLRPRTCKVTLQDGTVMEYPEPCRELLENGQRYWVAASSAKAVFFDVWNGHIEHYNRLGNGSIHLTEQAAQQHFEVLQAVNAQRAI